MTNATQEDLSAPVVLFYTEGRETYAVNAAGLIGRPAIGMKPSGGWRMTGIGSGRGFIRYSFPDLIRALLGGESIPNRSACSVYDWDHGTHRSHGSPALSRVWLAADHGLDAPALLELVDGLDASRRQREADAAKAANEARRVATEAQGRVGYYGPATNPAFTLYRFKRRPADYGGEGPAFGIVFREGVTTEPLEYGAACRALGAALLEEWGA